MTRYLIFAAIAFLLAMIGFIRRWLRNIFWLPMYLYLQLKLLWLRRENRRLHEKLAALDSELQPGRKRQWP